MDHTKATYEGRELDIWIGSYKVRAFPWPDSNDIYVNVQYFAPGQSTAGAPAFDKSVFIKRSLNGERLVFDLTHTLVDFASRLQIKEGCKVHIDVESAPPDLTRRWTT